MQELTTSRARHTERVSKPLFSPTSLLGVVQMASERLAGVVRPGVTAGKPDAVPLGTKTPPKKDRRRVDWHGHVQSSPEAAF